MMLLVWAVLWACAMAVVIWAIVNEQRYWS